MTAAGRVFDCVDSVTGCNLEPMCEFLLPVDCYVCLHAMVLVKIKLGWLLQDQNQHSAAQTVNMHDLHLRHDKGKKTKHGWC